MICRTGLRADDIGLDELARAVDRTVHVAFRREMHHVRRFELGKHAVELVSIADVSFFELEPVGFRDRGQILQIASVGELVDHANGIWRVVDDMSGYCRSDKSGSAGHDDAVHKQHIYC